MASCLTVTSGWRPDTSWCRPGDGAWVSGGVPRRLWRLGPAGRRVADAIEASDPLPSGHEALTSRLVAAGALHPEPPPRATALAHMAVVIPTYKPDPADLTRLVNMVRADFGDTVAIVIVDDASPEAVDAPPGAIVIRSERNQGPGGARNLGLVHVQTDLVVFLDDDVTPEPGWATWLVAHLEHDDTVAVAAPRVRGPAVDRTAGWRNRGEQVRSPLDLGPDPAPVRVGSTVPYVPAAALVVRRQAVMNVGGFDVTLRLGEDVDLMWRLHAAGYGVRYEPRAVVRHRTRDHWSGWLRQRFGYGTSAAALARRHPNTVVALRIHRRQFAVRAVRDLARLLQQRELPDPWRWAMRWMVSGHVAVARQWSAAMWRVWWPIGLVAALAVPRSRPVLIAATLGAIANDVVWWRRTPALDPLRFIVLARLDDVAYGFGVWWGVIANRTWAPLSVATTSPDTVQQP